MKRKRTKSAVMLLLTAVFLSCFILGGEVKAAAKKPAQAKITSVKGSNKNIAVKYKKVKGAKGYQVSVAENVKFSKGKKTVKVKGTKATVNSLSSGSKYYVRVRAYKKSRKKVIYGKWSKVKTCKTKNVSNKYDYDDDYDDNYDDNYDDSSESGGNGGNNGNNKPEEKLESISFTEDCVDSLYEGEDAKLHIVYNPSSAVHGKVSWSCSDDSVLRLWYSDNEATIAAIQAGTATVTVTVDGKSISRQITVKEYETKYNYEVNFLNPPYDNTVSIIYVKTDNPSLSFRIRLYTMDGELVQQSIMAGISYDDLELKTVATNGFYKVDGGFLGTFGIEGNGKMKVRVAEDVRINGERVWNGYKGEYVKAYADMGYIDVGNYEEEKSAWMQSIIDEVTTDSMTKPEKMSAIAKYMYDNSVYTKTPKGGKGYIWLAAEEGIPFWKKHPYEFNSYSSPALLEKFGDMIDYPMINLYYRYKSDTYEWQVWHYMVESVEDGSHYYFCHTMDNVIDPSTIEPLDLSTWNFYKCYGKE